MEFLSNKNKTKLTIYREFMQLCEVYAHVIPSHDNPDPTRWTDTWLHYSLNKLSIADREKFKNVKRLIASHSIFISNHIGSKE